MLTPALLPCQPPSLLSFKASTGVGVQSWCGPVSLHNHAPAQINTVAQRPERESEGEDWGGSRKEEEEGAVRAHLLSPLPTQPLHNTNVSLSLLNTHTHTHTQKHTLKYRMWCCSRRIQPAGGTFLAHGEHGEMQIKQQGLGPGVSASSDFTL